MSVLMELIVCEISNVRPTLTKLQPSMSIIDILQESEFTSKWIVSKQLYRLANNMMQISLKTFISFFMLFYFRKIKMAVDMWIVEILIFCRNQELR